MAGQGKRLGSVGLDGGHHLLLWLAEGHQQRGGDQTGTTAAPFAVDDQMFAIPQQLAQLRQRLLPGSLEVGVGGQIILDG